MKKLNIIALVVAITAVFAVSATANEWNLYGSARMATFYTSQDLGDLYTCRIHIPVGMMNSGAKHDQEYRSGICRATPASAPPLKATR